MIPSSHPLSGEFKLPEAYLIPVEGPALAPFTLRSADAGGAGITLGRHQNCELRLPISAEQTSRLHCGFRFADGQWMVRDLSSRRGTFVNGVKLNPATETALMDGDLIRVEPWTFELSGRLRSEGILSEDDLQSSAAHTLHPTEEAATRLDAEYLGLLLAASTAFHSAGDEKQLAESVLETAVRGTGLANAAVLRNLDSNGRVELIASNLGHKRSRHFRFSRALIAAAAGGRVAEVSGQSTSSVSESLISMKVVAALCVPLMLGPSTVFYLYLDARSDEPSAKTRPPLRPNAIAFATALGQLASLALANLKRLQMERRQMSLDKELRDAREAQRWILPRRTSQIGAYRCAGESKAGQALGGDFFELIDLGGGRLAIALGDVSGKGIVASVLMATTLGFLHAALRRFNEPGQAVTALNEYISPRRPDGRFVTLWVGVLDSAAAQLHYVDAGHGYAMLMDDKKTLTPLDAGGGSLIGLDPATAYETQVIRLPTRGTLIVFSDGIVEQPAAASASGPASARRPFDLAGVRAAMTAAADADLVQTLFASVIAHAGSDQLADDATIVTAGWSPNADG